MDLAIRPSPLTPCDNLKIRLSLSEGLASYSGEVLKNQSPQTGRQIPNENRKTTQDTDHHCHPFSCRTHHALRRHANPNPATRNHHGYGAANRHRHGLLDCNTGRLPGRNANGQPNWIPRPGRYANSPGLPRRHTGRLPVGWCKSGHRRSNQRNMGQVANAAEAPAGAGRYIWDIGSPRGYHFRFSPEL